MAAVNVQTATRDSIAIDVVSPCSNSIGSGRRGMGYAAGQEAQGHGAHEATALGLMKIRGVTIEGISGRQCPPALDTVPPALLSTG